MTWLPKKHIGNRDVLLSIVSNSYGDFSSFVPVGSIFPLFPQKWKSCYKAFQYPALKNLWEQVEL